MSGAARLSCAFPIPEVRRSSQHADRQKLWRELAEGHSFPTCSGASVHSSRSGYEPSVLGGEAFEASTRLVAMGSRFRLKDRIMDRRELMIYSW